MGSAGSKVARTAGSTTARKYPTRPSPSTQSAPPTAAPSQTTPQPAAKVGPTVHSNEGPRESRDHAINADASDPVLASKLRQIGPVEANPYQSHTSTQYQQSSRSHSRRALAAEVAPLDNQPPPGLFPDAASMRNNPALLVMQARKRWQEKAEYEFDNLGRSGFEGRETIDVAMVTDALKLRAKGVAIEDIEKRLGLKRGVMEKLGPRGVLEAGYA